MPATTVRRGAHRALVVVASATGTIVVVGSAIAALFERDGFGRPRDTEPRLSYLALLAVAVAFGVAIPVALIGWRTNRRGALVVALVAGAAAGFGLLGLTA
jgi:hypothetical protein